jgi:hypothetical protein
MCSNRYSDIFVNCSWVDTRWQQYSTHLHTNSTQNNTINNKTTRITNKTTQITNLEECWLCPVFANYTLAFALQLWKNLSQGSRRDSKYTHYQDTHTLQFLSYSNANFILLKDFFEKSSQILNFIKKTVQSEPSCSMWMDRHDTNSRCS